MKKVASMPAILSPEMTLFDLMRHYPLAIPILLRRKMACVGCNMAAFDTLAEAAEMYELDLNHLLLEISQALAADAIRTHPG